MTVKLIQTFPNLTKTNVKNNGMTTKKKVPSNVKIYIYNIITVQTTKIIAKQKKHH